MGTEALGTKPDLTMSILAQACPQLHLKKLMPSVLCEDPAQFRQRDRRRARRRLSHLIGMGRIRQRKRVRQCLLQGQPQEQTKATSQRKQKKKEEEEKTT